MGSQIGTLWQEWKVRYADQLLPLTDTIDHDESEVGLKLSDRL